MANAWQCKFIRLRDQIHCMVTSLSMFQLDYAAVSMICRPVYLALSAVAIYSVRMRAQSTVQTNGLSVVCSLCWIIFTWVAVSINLFERTFAQHMVSRKIQMTYWLQSVALAALFVKKQESWSHEVSDPSSASISMDLLSIRANARCNPWWCPPDRLATSSLINSGKAPTRHSGW